MPALPDMRFAPPNPLRIADRSSGLNAISVRSYNERLVLSLLLQNHGISRMEIGERSGLSAQTVSVIVRSLEQAGLVSKGEAQRGRVGPPTIPLSLNPEGAFSVGISIGYHRTEVVLIDFVGAVRFYTTLPNPKEKSGNNHSRFLDTIQNAVAIIPKKMQGRIAGIGLALPEDVGAWGNSANGVSQKLSDLQEEIENEIGLPFFIQNDITAAASGESMFGNAKPLTDYLFIYLGARLHSRLVLNHQIYNGNSSMSFDAGIESLENELKTAGYDTEQLWERKADWPQGEVVDRWRGKCLDQIKRSVDALAQFVDVKTIVLSSYAPEYICKAICKELEALAPGVTAIAGNIAIAPKAVGAASLPFSSRFMIEER